MRVFPMFRDPPKPEPLITVKARISNCEPEVLAAWAAEHRYDCTITVHTGVWFDLDTKITLVEPGLTLEMQLNGGTYKLSYRRNFELRLTQLLETLDEQYAWVEYDGVGRLV